MTEEQIDVWYHGTSRENWGAIQRDGILWGVRENAPSRCTYLAREREEAAQYGDVVLKVRYVPQSKLDNYGEGCWQVRVYDPIPLSDCEVLEATR